MIELDEHEGSYLEICKHYKAVYETSEVRENSDKLKEVLLFFSFLVPLYESTGRATAVTMASAFELQNVKSFWLKFLKAYIS